MGNAPCSRREPQDTVKPEVLLCRLKRAAYKGSKKDLRELLKAGAPVDGCHKYGKTALHEAVRHGQFRCVEILLGHNANVNISTYDGLTPLHEAAEHGFVDCLIALLNHGAEINAVTRSRWTALHYAARNGHQDCLEVLLERGANVNAMANGGWRPLHASVRHGHTTCVELLLKYDAEVDPPLIPACRVSSEWFCCLYLVSLWFAFASQRFSSGTLIERTVLSICLLAWWHFVCLGLTVGGKLWKLKILKARPVLCVANVAPQNHRIWTTPPNWKRRGNGTGLHAKMTPRRECGEMIWMDISSAYA